MTIIRICELQPGDLFMYETVWRRVTSIEYGKLWYVNPKGTNLRHLSAGSKQFVEAVRKQDAPPPPKRERKEYKANYYQRKKLAPQKLKIQI